MCVVVYGVGDVGLGVGLVVSYTPVAVL